MAIAEAPAPRRPSRRPRLLWSRLHFLVRFLGLTGLLVGCCGLVLAGLHGLLASWPAARDAARSALDGSGWPLARTGDAATIGVYLVLGGVAVIVFALLIEAVSVFRVAAGRRGAFGLNAVVQVGLAAALLVIVNVWSFGNPLRFDWTRDRQFTLPADVRTDLRHLAAGPGNETTVIVYQRHKSFLTDQPDRYDYAAERKVVEKVKDLAEQFRQVGPQLRVEVLDVEEEGYEEKLARLTAGAPELLRAIRSAPESTIFVRSGDHVQQLAFNEFYLLDKVASRRADGGRGNLVLLAQGGGTSGRGVEPLARRVLNLDERRPRVGVLVVHEYLTTEGAEDDIALGGLRKALEARGFSVRDVVLRKGWENRSPEPAADSLEEAKLERLESELEDARDDVKSLETVVGRLEAQLKEWSLEPGEDEAKKLERLAAKYGESGLTSENRREAVAQIQTVLGQVKEVLADKVRERDESEKELKQLRGNDSLLEARRMTDVRKKLERALADCDLLLIPRLTRRSNNSLLATTQAHHLSEEQVAAVRDFIRSGKPVLACLGPGNVPAGLGLEDPAGDPLEKMFEDLGFHLGKQTVLFDSDSKAFADRRPNPLRRDGSGEKVPTLDIEGPPSRAFNWLRKGKAEPLPPNRVREGLRVLAHSLGEGFDLRARFPRPVYYHPARTTRPAAAAGAAGLAAAPLAPAPLLVAAAAAGGRGLADRATRFDPALLLTAERSWNDDQPFSVRGRRPHYEPPKPDDPATGTPDVRRRGPFPVGVAAEVPLPNGGDSTRTVRLAVLGQAEFFTGPRLSPARERLFLQTANWLLGRDDDLPRDDHPWSYPRIHMAAQEQSLWGWGTRLGLPVLFAYLGLVVLLLRRLR